MYIPKLNRIQKRTDRERDIDDLRNKDSEKYIPKLDQVTSYTSNGPIAAKKGKGRIASSKLNLSTKNDSKEENLLSNTF